MNKTTIINGQPQGLGNKMVTYDGLIDFLKMLKDEIPRMGYNNKHLYSEYVYSEGAGNSIETAKYGKVIGYSNTVYSQNPELFQNFFIAGSNNRIASDGKNIFIFGTDNAGHGSNLLLIGEENKADWDCANAYGFGSHLTLTSDAVWMGQYNDPKANIVFGIGNGDSNKRSNFLTIDTSGGITLQNAHFNTEVAFQSGINLNDSLTIGPGKTIIVDYFGEVRHVLMPYNNNEGFWLVDNEEDSFHINYRQPDDSGGYTQEQTYQYCVPKEIHFHAGGGQESWATIRCGSVHIGSGSQITAANRQITLAGNVTINGSAKQGDSYTGTLTCNDLTVLRNPSISGAQGGILAQGKVKGDFLESATGKIVTENDILQCCNTTNEAPIILNCHSIQTQQFDNNIEIPYGTQLCFVQMRFDVIYHDSNSSSFTGSCYHSGLLACLNSLLRTYSWFPFNTSIPCTVSNQEGESREFKVTPSVTIQSKKITATATVDQYGATASVANLQYQIILTS